MARKYGYYFFELKTRPLFFIFLPQFVAKYGTKSDYFNNLNAWTANYSNANNVSKVSDGNDARGGQH